MLYILATPIGNIGDISMRGLEVLRDADVLACEDTRRTRNLLTKYEIPRPAQTLSYREGNEDRMGSRILQLVEEGSNVVLCSDGGYPGISDPGYRLVKMFCDANVEYEVIPGASAVPIALLKSGLPTSSYTFKGFPPRKPGKLRKFFEAEKDLPHTLVVYESPYRVIASLRAALEVLGNREAAVCLELTKKFERASRGNLSDLVEEYTDKKIKGEAVIVIVGNNPKFTAKQ
ncbi:16S rRNA (cytidine(1402)-2'-O)-methyltransferase [bacterium B17]|nr:16S rRNA (cytidine(1402)-2'-O)-methyltransferase [bacterium B17]